MEGNEGTKVVFKDGGQNTVVTGWKIGDDGRFLIIKSSKDKLTYHINKDSIVVIKEGIQVE